MEQGGKKNEPLEYRCARAVPEEFVPAEVPENVPAVIPFASHCPRIVSAEADAPADKKSTAIERHGMVLRNCEFANANTLGVAIARPFG
jgi:hypothetical protein